MENVSPIQASLPLPVVLTTPTYSGMVVGNRAEIVSLKFSKLFENLEHEDTSPETALHCGRWWRRSREPGILVVTSRLSTALDITYLKRPTTPRAGRVARDALQARGGADGIDITGWMSSSLNILMSYLRRGICGAGSGTGSMSERRGQIDTRN